MKVFAIILSVYILALTAIPCADVPTNYTMHKITLSQDKCTAHDTGCDCCSPFCTCNCCTSPVLFQINSIQFNSFLYLTQEYICGFISTTVSTISTSIWQPPKSC